MYNGGAVLGASTAATGAASVALLPNTGGFRPLFVIGATLLAVGVLTLIATGIAAVKQSNRA